MIGFSTTVTTKTSPRWLRATSANSPGREQRFHRLVKFFRRERVTGRDRQIGAHGFRINPLAALNLDLAEIAVCAAPPPGSRHSKAMAAKRRAARHAQQR